MQNDRGYEEIAQIKSEKQVINELLEFEKVLAIKD